MFKTCFTINCNRTTEEFASYQQLVTNNLFQAVEIFYPYNKEENDRLIYQQNVFKLQKDVQEVVLHLPHGPQNDLCDIKKYKDVLGVMKKSINFGRQFNVKKYTLHLGYQQINDEYRDRDLLLKHLVTVLVEICEFAYPSYIMIENMPGNNEMGYSPNEIKKIIETVDRDNLKFIFDTGHAHLSTFGCLAYIDELKEFLFHIHLSDNDKSGDQHGPFGSGTIDFISIFKELKESKYQGLLSFEMLYNDEKDLILYHQMFSNLLKET